MAQKRSLVAELRTSRYENVATGLPGVTIIEGRARLISPTAVQVNGQRIEGDRILIATGARPAIPPIPGLEEGGCQGLSGERGECPHFFTSHSAASREQFW